MPVEITARHMDASDRLQSYAREKADTLVENFPRVQNVHIILDVEKHNSIARILISAKNNVHAESEERADNMRVAIDLAVDKVERQLRRQRDKVQDHKVVMKREEMGRTRATDRVDDERGPEA